MQTLRAARIFFYLLSFLFRIYLNFWQSKPKMCLISLTLFFRNLEKIYFKSAI